METENKMTLPEKLVALRKEKKLTQLDVAEELDVSRQAVSRWESGAVTPGTDKLKALSDLYGVSIDFLLDDATVISRQAQDEAISEPAAQKNPSAAWLYAALIAMTIIAATAIILLIHSRSQYQSRSLPKGIPIEDLSTSTEDDGYSVGTFPLE